VSASQIEVHAAVDRLPADAMALLQAAEAAGAVYAGPDWFRLFQAEVPVPAGGGDEFWLLRRDGRCRVVLPLRSAASAGLQGRRVAALGNYYTGLFAPAHQDAEPGDWASLLRAAIDGRAAGRQPADRLVLEPLPGPGPLLQALQSGMEAAGLAWRAEPAFGNWHEPVAAGFGAYWAARPGALRHTAERAARRFARAGGTLELVDGRDPAALAAAVQAYDEVYRASWKPQEPYPGFMPGLATLAARRGWLRLGVARLDGRPLAAHLWLVQGGRAEIYKLAYDESAKPWSVGTLLGRRLAEHVIEVDGVHELDYVSGDDAYKRQWMGQRRERWRLDALNPRTARGLLATLRRRWRG
jgi:CelD/BcsL family acetyltransferase involved in cellulose biosynthesis